MKIQEMIHEIMQTVDASLDRTVDTIKCGDGSIEASGVVTTFTATMDVLRQAVAMNANFIITHEPTFYNHRDETEWLAEDPVYQAKREFIDRHGLTIWRFHDYVHLHKPDLITTGVLKQLGWEHYRDQTNEEIAYIPKLTLKELADHLKSKLSIPSIRLVGDADMTCQRIGMLLGGSGGEHQLQFLQNENVDVILCGETVEWQVCEYVRDANLTGRQLSLVILGHFHSEDAGMKYLAELLREKTPGLPIEHIAAGDPVTSL